MCRYIYVLGVGGWMMGSGKMVDIWPPPTLLTLVNRLPLTRRGCNVWTKNLKEEKSISGTPTILSVFWKAYQYVWKVLTIIRMLKKKMGTLRGTPPNSEGIGSYPILFNMIDNFNAYHLIPNMPKKYIKLISSF